MRRKVPHIQQLGWWGGGALSQKFFKPNIIDKSLKDVARAKKLSKSITLHAIAPVPSTAFRQSVKAFESVVS
jgi:hypothetical protein